ncbi:MAG: DNA polymerase III subunit beta [Armatimonadota bacterium]
MLKVSCAKQALLDSVGTVSRGVSGRSTQPVQNNIYLEASGNQLRLVATDLEYLSLEAVIEAEVLEEGAITVPARLFADVMSALPNDDVKLTADETNGMNIKCGRSKYDIRGLSAADFSTLPSVAQATELELEQGKLLMILERTVFSTSRDETRPILTGALFKLTGNLLEVVATDTYRLALQSLELETPVSDSRSAIVSRRALTELMRILSADSTEPVKIRFAESQVEFKVGNVSLSSRLIEGQFVNYAKVVPSSFERKVSCSIKEYGAALHRALIVAREDANRVVLKTEDGSLKITASSQDVGTVEESIPVRLEGEDAEIAFNARYVIDMLDAIKTDEVAMELSGPLNSGALKPVGDESYLYVLMPMQIM